MVRADSPLTSTDLTLGYTDSENVAAAKASFVINESVLKFLTGNGPIAEKMAVICQFGWLSGSYNNATIFSEYLLKLRKSESNYTGDDYLCLAYIYALGNYLYTDKEMDMTEPLKYSAKAIEKNGKSYTFQIIRALIVAEVYNYDVKKWCDVYKVCDAVRTDKSLKQDMASASIKGIFDYIDIFKDECK